MKLRVYSVRDIKADAFAPPFFLGRDEVAARSFSDAIHDPKHPMASHPEDYELYCLGDFDDETGRIEPAQNPIFLVNGNGEMSRG